METVPPDYVNIWRWKSQVGTPSESLSSSKSVQVDDLSPKLSNVSIPLQVALPPPEIVAYSSPVQMEVISPEPSISSCKDQCPVHNWKDHMEMEKMQSGANVKVPPVTLEDRGVETDPITKHHVETFEFTAQNLPLVGEPGEEEVYGWVSSGPISERSSGRSSGQMLPPEASAVAVDLCKRASKELDLHRRLVNEKYASRRRQSEDEEERRVQTVAKEVVILYPYILYIFARS